ncbi:MAG: PAS domain S-box protein [Candidatus Hydrothermarchaeales archaeon]
MGCALAQLQHSQVDVMKNTAERQKKDRAYFLDLEERYQILVENTNDAICFISPEGEYLFYNSKFLEMFGYSEEEMEDKTFYDIVHPDDLSLVKKRREARLRGGDVPRNYEYRAITKDGSTLYIETNATLVKRGDEVLGIQTILRDVTERKRVEEALRDSEERYRALFEQAADSIGLVDPKTGALVEFNDRTHENLGYTREEFKKLKIPDFEVIESAEEVAKHIKKIIKDGADTFETKHRTKGGEIRDILVSSRTINIHGQDFIQSIWRDNTERKKAEGKIKHLKEFNENIVQSMKEGIMIEDENGIITFVNPKTEELLGYSKGELIRKHWKELASPKYVKKVEEETAKRPKGISSSYETAVLTKTGKEIPIIISATPIFENSAFKGVLAVYTDISELKTLEQQHIDAKNEAEFYIDLMGHDINNANTIALGLLDLILAESSKLSENQFKHITKAFQAVRRSSNLIDNVRILQIAKATGKETFKIMDISFVLNDAIKEAKALHIEKDIKVNYKPKEALIYTDDLVKDLFLNLIDNAAKYDRSDNVSIEIGVEDLGDSWKINIKDHGMGIPDDMKEVIFTRFQRIDEGVRGSGIGLHLVKTLVDKYKGNVWVEDRIKGDHSKGSIFYVTLPKGLK